MPFDSKYDSWNHSRVKAIISHFSYSFFKGKRILDLGAGHGDIAAAFVRLGADVTCIDVREENLEIIRRKHPYLKTVKIDLDNAWPFSSQVFDVVFSLGLICHLKNYERHIREICGVAENIVIETEVLNCLDPNLRMPTHEEKTANDLSFHGEGSIVSAAAIQGMLSELGATFKRVDDFKINSGPYRYDWREEDNVNPARDQANRRLWFARIDKHYAKMLANQQHTAKAEAAIINSPPQPPMPRPAPTFRNPNTGLIYKEHVRKQQPSITPITQSISIQTDCPKIRLFYNYYEDKNPERQKELDFCLNKNKENPLLDVIVFEHNTIPTYNFFFDKINEITGPNDINIICNSDVFFDHTISLAANIGARDMYALSRWEWRDENNITHRALRNSQDAWVVRGKVTIVDGSFQLGKPFCDNRIAYEFNRSGYNILNPSKSIKTYHVHNSGVRHYSNSERVDGPSLFVEPTDISHAPIYALTSMSPRQDQFSTQKKSILSWLRAGCEVVAFQSAAEIKSFNKDDWYGVKFVETEPSKQFPGYIPISSMTKWGVEKEGYSMLINSDCCLDASPFVMQNFTTSARDGLVYFARHDVHPDGRKVRFNVGFDAFIFPNKYAKLIPNSDMLCMGKPWWDYVVPMSILAYGKPIFSPTFPILFHTVHPQKWSSGEYGICRDEAFRALNWKKVAGEMLPEIIRNTRNIDRQAR